MHGSSSRRTGLSRSASLLALVAAHGVAGAQVTSPPSSTQTPSNNTGGQAEIGAPAPLGTPANGSTPATMSQTVSSAPAPAPAQAGLQDIVVTARRVSEDLQKVPISIGTLNPTALQSRQIFAITDLKGSVAGLTTAQTTTAGGAYFSIRGITTGSLPSPAIDSAIGFYIDGVYIARSEGQGVDLPDLARVEVLRGPQGTLFGRNSAAGAINFVTNDPTDKQELKFNALYGNYNAIRAAVILNQPIGNDLAVRIAYQHNQYNGDVRNTTTSPGTTYVGPVPGFGTFRPAPRFGGTNNETVIAKVRYTGVDGLTLDYKYDYEDVQQSPGANQRVGFLTDRASSGVNLLLGLLYPAQDKAKVPQSFKRLGALPDGDQSVADISQEGHLITAAYQATDEITLKNITAFRKLRVNYTAGLDGSDWTLAPFAPATPLSLASAFNDMRQRQYTQENQIIGNFGRFSFIAGGYYFSEHARYAALTNITAAVPQLPNVYTPSTGTTQALVLGSFLTTQVPSPFAIGEFGRYRNQSVAGYAHAEYDFNDIFKLAVGGRYTSDKRRTQDLRSFAFQGQQRASYDRFNYDVAVNAQVDPRKLLYVKYGTGYVSGGIYSQLAFRPEDDRQVEVGFKTEWLDRRLRVNGSAYYTWRKNVQAAVPSVNTATNPTLSGIGLTPPFPLGILLFNRSGTSTVKGFELETTLNPFAGLLLTANVGYNDPKFADGSYYIAPKVQFAFSGQYDFPRFANDSFFTVRVDGDYRSKYYGTGLNTPGFFSGTTSAVLLAAAGYGPTESARYASDLRKAAFAGDYWLVNGRVSLADVPFGNTKGKISGFVRNIFNSQQLFYVLNYGSGVNGTFERPRTYGVELNLDF